jgi:hypothetical protein
MFDLSSFLVALPLGLSYGLVFYAGAVALLDRAWARAEAEAVQ